MSQSTNQIVYVSNVTIEPVTGAIRHAYLPPDKTQVTFGVHNEIAEHYGVDASERKHIQLLWTTLSQQLVVECLAHYAGPLRSVEFQRIVITYLPMFLGKFIKKVEY